MKKTISIESQWGAGLPRHLCIDFDGVLHSYESGWQGPNIIPDPPVEGALVWLIQLINYGFQPCIYSSRSKWWCGRRAMKKWFYKYYWEMGDHELWTSLPLEFQSWIGSNSVLEDPRENLHWAIKKLIAKIKFPTKKPPAFVTIDDRAICFRGTFPTPKEINAFKAWNKGWAKTDTLEALADYAHKAWSGWMIFLFSKSITNDDGSVTIPKGLVERWGRQAGTFYDGLPEGEKKSDRDEARKILEIIERRSDVRIDTNVPG